MRIALAQINPTVGDLAGNVARCESAVDLARARGVDLVVLPAMALPGSPPRDILFDGSFIDALAHAAADLAQRVRGGPPVLVGSVWRAQTAPISPKHPNLYDAVLLLQDGRVGLAGTRRCLRSEDVFFETRWFVPGPELPPLEIGGRRVGILPGGDLPAGGAIPPADLLICPSAESYRRGIFAERLEQARRTGLTVAFVNLCGGTDELVYDGRSFALDASGRLRVRAKASGEDLRILDLDEPPRSAFAAETPDPDEELFEVLCLGVRDFFEKNRIRRAFVGLSGGVDSTVTACIACAALGPERVTGVSIPSRHTDPRSVESARELCQNLGVGFEVLPLEPLHAAAEAALAPLLDQGTGPENLQARLRALILMAYVNRYGGLLLNTTNKTELSVGYITLYGDMAGMLSPIGDLTKLEVFALARWIDAHRTRIPPFILERAPTAELSPGQVDPFNYALASPELEALVQADQSNAALSGSEYKRRQMGVILRVSGRAFGPGRMVPITRR
jgi:NAD+ synthase (glutamine-hydrolysing)